MGPLTARLEYSTYHRKLDDAKGKFKNAEGVVVKDELDGQEW